jgi:hypothetical protein
MNAIKIAQGETDSLTGTATGAEPFLVEISTTAQNEYVLIGKSSRNIRTHGQRYYDGDRARLTAHAGETLYCHAPNSDAEIEIRPEGFDVDLFPRRSVYEIERVDQIDSIGNLQNHDAVQSFTHDPNTDGSVPSNDVPPGIEVVVQASLANDSASHVEVGNHELGPGDSISLRVTNTDKIDVSAPTTGDVVNITWEA